MSLHVQLFGERHLVVDEGQLLLVWSSEKPWKKVNISKYIVEKQHTH